MKRNHGSDDAILTRVRAFRDEWVELLGVDPADSDLAAVGISRATWRAIAAGRTPWVPISAYRLAQFRRRLELGELLGPGWEDVAIDGGCLVLPGVKRALPAAELRAVWFQLQEIPRLRAEVSLLRRDLDRLAVAAEDAERSAAFYRRQCRLEAGLGMMLSRVA